MDAKVETPVDVKPKLSVRDLNFYYGGFRALKNISLDIPEKKVTSFIGPSGCGKTTFLRTLNRMHELARNASITGKVLVDGTDIYASNVDPVLVRKKIGMVFQKPNPFPTMSIYDNVVAGLKLTGRHKRKELDEVVEKTLVQAALWDEVKDSLKKSGASLSGGQQQRLCIARALATRPSVILLDEPAGGVNPTMIHYLTERIRELNREHRGLDEPTDVLAFPVDGLGPAAGSGPPCLQAVSASPASIRAWLSASAGVLKPSVLRGLRFSFAAISSSSA